MVPALLAPPGDSTDWCRHYDVIRGIITNIPKRTRTGNENQPWPRRLLAFPPACRLTRFPYCGNVDILEKNVLMKLVFVHRERKRINAAQNVATKPEDAVLVQGEDGPMWLHVGLKMVGHLCGKQRGIVNGGFYTLRSLGDTVHVLCKLTQKELELPLEFVKQKLRLCAVTQESCQGATLMGRGVCQRRGNVVQGIGTVGVVESSTQEHTHLLARQKRVGSVGKVRRGVWRAAVVRKDDCTYPNSGSPVPSSLSTLQP